jgi:hypothetical protein
VAHRPATVAHADLVIPFARISGIKPVLKSRQVFSERRGA